MRKTTIFWRCRCYPPNRKLFFFFVKSFTHASHFLVPVFFGQPDSPTMLLYIHRLRCLGASNCVNRFWSTVFLHGLARPKNIAAVMAVSRKGGRTISIAHVWWWKSVIPSASLTAGEIRIMSQVYINRVAVPRNQLPFQYMLEYSIFQNWQDSYKTRLVPIPQTTIRACTHDKTHQIYPNLATTSRAENPTVFRKFYSHIAVTPANPNVLICSEYVNYMFVTIYQFTMCVFI